MRAELKKNQGEVMAKKGTSKKTIEARIRQAERECEWRRYGLSHLQIAVLDRIKQDCEGVRPRWDLGKKLVCSLVMRDLKGRWSEQSFRFWFQNAATLEGMRLSGFDQKGGFWMPLAKDVERVIKEFIANPPNG